MRILGFDTSTDDTVVAASDGEIALAERRAGPDASGRPVHSGALLALIGEAVTAAGGWDRIDRIAVGTGPGTFTGIRIGIATARGLALSTGVPLTGISTLAALAVGAARQGNGDAPVLAVLDARRGEVFAGLYSPAGLELEPPVVCSPEALADRLDETGSRLERAPLVAGPGAVRFKDRLERAGIPVPAPESDIHRLAGHALCELGAGVSSTDTARPLEPTYLRVPDAQLWLERDHRDPSDG